MHDLLLDVDLPRILLSAPEGYCAGPYGGYWVIIVEVCQRSVCRFGNHFELRFGDSNRDCDPYCDNVL